MKTKLSLVGLSSLILLLAACDDNGNSTSGIASLGRGFLEAFNQEPNDEPLALDDITLAMTPGIEPFNP